MLLPRIAVYGLCPVWLLILTAGPVVGQNFPSKPVRIVMTGVGGGTDFVARIIAQGLTASLGQQVVVDSRPSGVIAGDFVAKSPPDGHTLHFHGSALWLAPFLESKVPFDPIKDFAPITLATRGPNVLVVHPSLPVRSVKELVALARAQPGTLNYATGAAGSQNHIAGELLNSMAGIKLVRIPYKGTALAIVSLMAGEVHLAFSPASTAAPHIQSGRVRAIAVASAQPSSIFPGLPTVASSGFPGFEADAVYGLSAPARTPAAIINVLNQETVRAIRSTEAKQPLLNAGLEAVGSTPEEFAAFARNDMNTSGKLLKAGGFQAQ